MGNSLESSSDIFEETFVNGDAELLNSVEEMLEPLAREAIVSNIASGLKNMLEVIAVGSLATMQVIKYNLSDDSVDSDSEDLDINLKKSADSLPHEFSKL
ncbi:hypothetical protein SteCoe_6942 [Stentor coeruleus]|uniref:Uncharacterized protein n=1 Tax=Stentor coeruleus TaxID=5963 RepID=A0A1R2CNV1_9CILI|nr:hypothetical protein SteCoe_6942 [Stentor coeruleus]